MASFSKLIELKYYSKIYNEVKKFIFYNKDKIKFTSNVIDEIKTYKIEDLYFKRTYVEEFNGFIKIKIVIEVELTISQYKKSENYYDTIYPNFTCDCCCILTDEIENFNIDDVGFYEKFYFGEYSLTDNLIPYISKEKMEIIAEKILVKFYPNALIGERVNPHIFSKILKLNVIQKEFNTIKILGKFYFEEHIVKSKNPNKKSFVIPKNSIVVSKNSTEKVKNFTIMHECAHFLLHQNSYKLEKLFNKKASSISCCEDYTGKTDLLCSPIEWMEWQANALASKLLMPRKPLIEKVDKLVDEYKFRNETNNLLPFYESLIKYLSNYYGVSIEAMKLRLIEVGYDFPLGCFIRIGENIIPTHTAPIGYLKVNETFSISEFDAARFYFQEKIRGNESINAYLFIESHFCINDKKYIYKDKNGKMALTDYARLHMDKCCIKFELDIPGENDYKDINIKTLKILCRKPGNNANIVIRFEKAFIDGAQNNDKIKIDEFLKLENELYLSMTNIPKQCFKAIKDYSGYTLEELEEISKLSKATLDRYFYKDEKVGYKKENIVRFLLANNVPYKASIKLLDVCCCPLNLNNSKDQIIDFVLNKMWFDDFEENINFLQKYDVII